MADYLDPMMAATMLRGQAAPAMAKAPPAEPDSDRAALINALRRHGDLGVMMNLAPTAALGQALHQRASGYEALDREDAATRRQEALQQAQWQAQEQRYQAQMQRYAAEQAMRERDYRLRASEAQRRADMADRDVFQAVTDPVTGKNSVFNKRTGEFVHGGQEPAPAAPPPDSGYGFSGVPGALPFKTQDQGLNYSLADNMAKNLAEMEKMLGGEDGWRPSKLDAVGSGPAMGGVLGAAQSPFTRWVGSDKGAAYYTSAKALLDNIMKKMQGDTYTEAQYENAVRTYIPGPGDSDAVVKQKLGMLKSIIDATAAQSGPAAQYWNSATNASQGAATNQPVPSTQPPGGEPGVPGPGATRDNPKKLDY